MNSKIFTLLGCTFVAACSSGSTEDSAQTLFFGAPDNSGSFGGQAFADGTQTLADTQGQTFNIKVARYLTDYATGETRLVISDETVTFDAADGGNVEDLTITIGDETLVFSSGSATDSNGRGWDSYQSYGGNVSTTGAVYSYSYGGNEAEAGALDTEAFFAFGFETNPDTIAALMTNPTYTGDWEGYGVVLDETGAIVGSEQYGDGTVTLTADFNAGTIGGSLAGSYETFGDVDGTIASSNIQGNGFLGDLSIDTCAVGSTCTSNSQIAGVFYGDAAQEISGVLGIDATSTNDTTGESLRVISGGSFFAD